MASRSPFPSFSDAPPAPKTDSRPGSEVAKEVLAAMDPPRRMRPEAKAMQDALSLLRHELGEMRETIRDRVSTGGDGGSSPTIKGLQAALATVQAQVMALTSSVQQLTGEGPVPAKESKAGDAGSMLTFSDSSRGGPSNGLVAPVARPPLRSEVAALTQGLAEVKAAVTHLGERRVKRRVIRDSDGLITSSIEEPIDG